jgi:signal transduction histidine kinase
LEAIEAADAARARLARDLHDGAQQRLVHTVVALKLTQRAIQQRDGTAEALVSQALEHAEQANAELRDLARGTMPAILRHRGLRAGVESLAERAPLPVAVDVFAQRLDEAIEVHAYLIVAEALTNVVKHARARSAEVRAAVGGDVLRVRIRDDGIGGARLEGSSGLLGLDDRVRALHGTLRVISPPGQGTLIEAKLAVSA